MMGLFWCSHKKIQLTPLISKKTNTKSFSYDTRHTTIIRLYQALSFDGRYSLVLADIMPDKFIE